MNENFILDEKHRLQLAKEDIAVYSQNGEVIGHIISHEEYNQILYSLERLDPVPIEELEAAAKKPEVVQLPNCSPA